MARSLKLLALVALLAALVPAGPVAAQEPAPSCRLIREADTANDVTVCRKDVWFHQTGSQLGNLAAFGQGSFPTWDTTKPTASVATGAGGGYLSTSTFHQLVQPWDSRGTAVFEGTFTGDIDTLAATLYLLAPVKQAQGAANFHTNVQLLVDSQTVFGGNGIAVKYTPGGQAVKRIDFALVNVSGVMEELGLAGAEKTHAVRLSVVGTGLGDGGALFVYDTSEVPSGMIFNIEPENLASYTVIDAGV